MRLLLDQGLPRTAADLLHSAGMDAVHTGECGLATASDIAILEYTRAEDAIVVTLDADFHALMALSGATQPSVIRIRIKHSVRRHSPIFFRPCSHSAATI